MIAEEVLPEGYTTTLSGRAEQFKESFVSMVMVFGLAIAYYLYGAGSAV